MKRIMLVVGEASGDALGARLIKRLKEISPYELEFFGATGEKLRACGVETIVRSDALSIVGLIEIAQSLPMFWRTFRRLKLEALRRKPDVVILIDFPEFNLKLAKALKRMGLKIIYYVSPQIWAWRSYRINTIKKYVDLLLTILPFEKDWYLRRGVYHVEYVGNPLINEVYPKLSRNEFCLKHGLNPENPVIALLAGSRHKEIVRILPVLLESAELATKINPNIQFVNALAPMRQVSEVKTIEESLRKKLGSLKAKILTVQGETYDALNTADLAVVTSGTATLETAIIGTPMIVVYKTSYLNYILLRPLIEVPHFSLVNLIANETVVPELIQDEFTPEALVKKIFQLLENEKNQNMRTKLKDVVDKLGQGGAALRAARVILNFMEHQ
jgi:lipid-A-disaccharide synthase